MNLNESYDELARLDKPDFIGELNFSGLNFWPLFRFHLLLKFKNSEEYFAFSNKRSGTEKKGFLPGLKEKFSYRKNLNRQFSALKKLPANGCFFISDRNYYTDRVNKLAYNRHIDPYYGTLKALDYSCLKISVDEVDPRSEKYHYPLDVFFSRFFYLAVHRLRYEGKEFDQLQERLEKLCEKEKVQVNVPVLTRNIFRIRHLVPLYKKILDHARPRIIFLTCFYEPEKFALIAAAKSLKIPVVDIQHGKQGVKHHLYDGWKHVPEKGYDFLPDHFWNWGESSAKNISDHFNSSKNRPVCIPGGNGWLALWINGKISGWQGPMPYEHKNFDKKILIALQPVATAEFVKFITDLAHLRKNYLLMLRLHPVMQKDREVFENLARQYENIEINDSSKIPLYSLLRYANASITAWSSVIVESRYFNVPGYLMHETGASIFKDDVAAKKLFYTPTAETFVGHFEQGPVTTKDDFILTDEKVMTEELKKLCAV